MTPEIEGEIDNDSRQLDGERSVLRKQLIEVDQKSQRLTEAYVANVLTLDEFQQSKVCLVSEKAGLKQKSALLQKNPSYWLEPTEQFVKSLFEAALTACSENAAEKAKLLKKTGSNLRMQDGRIEMEFRGPWKIVEKHGRLAQPNVAPDISGATLGWARRL